LLQRPRRYSVAAHKGLRTRASESNSLQPTASTRNDTMKNRHKTPVTTPTFCCNALIHSQMRKIMSSRGTCFVSNSVYFCLLIPTNPNLHQPTSFPSQKGQTWRGSGFRPHGRASEWSVCKAGLAPKGRDTYPPRGANEADGPLSHSIRAAPIRDTRASASSVPRHTFAPDRLSSWKNIETRLAAMEQVLKQQCGSRS